MSLFELHHGDCRDVMDGMPADSVDTIICDPPYALTNRVADVQCCHDCGRVMGGNDGNGNVKACPKCHSVNIGSRRSYVGSGFMGKDWDTGLIAFSPEVWRSALRVAKPGATLLAFGGTRTHHRLMVAIEDAGWEIRDVVMWVYGSGFPKSHNIGKAIDKRRDDDVRHVCEWLRGQQARAGVSNAEIDAALGLNSNGASASHWTAGPEYKQPRVPPWDYWLIIKDLLNMGDEMDAEVWRLNGRKGQPGEAWFEREVVGQSENGIAGGTHKHAGQDGAWGFNGEFNLTAPATDAAREWDGWGTALKPAWEPIIVAMKPLAGTFAQNALEWGVAGLNIDGGRVEAPDGVTSGGAPTGSNNPMYMSKDNDPRTERATPHPQGRWPANLIHDGSAEVLAGFPGENGNSAARYFYTAKASRSERNAGLEGNGNGHPTVKPLALMRYLCRLTATPTGGVVLDPFMGSGSTGCAAVLEGRDFIGIDQEAEYVEIARRRIEHWREQVDPQMELFT